MSLTAQKILIGLFSLLLLASVVTIGAVKVQEARAEVPAPYVTAESAKCIGCHQSKGITANSIRDWQLSAHAQKGVGCDQCHVPAADAPAEVKNATTTCEDKRVRMAVAPQNCSSCHQDQVKQFSNGKHALAMAAMNAMPTTSNQPAEMIAGQKGCGGCHSIGLNGGKCDACHTGMKFSAAEARKPEACETCHMGFDHPQWEMWSTSKHGAIYMTEGKNWDFTKKIADWTAAPYTASSQTPRSPVCVTCHMQNGDHGVLTAWGFLGMRLPEPDQEWMGYRATILQGAGVLDENGKTTGRLDVVVAGNVARLKAEDWQAQRDKMIKTCAGCHSTDFAKKHLEAADQVIKDSDRLLAGSITVVQKLYKDGILPKPKDYPASVDLLRFFNVQSPIEMKLWTMFQEDRMKSFQGAFHMNPDYQFWYGWAQLNRDAVEIQAEADALRAASQTK